MTFFHALVLGIVEGLTEFLPVSSTGHLILASGLLGVPESPFLETFTIAIQLGAIASVLALFWRELWGKWDTLKKLAVAFLPTGVIGLAAYPFVKEYLVGNVRVVLWALLLGGIVLVAFERWYAARQARRSSVGVRDALLLGVFQTLAFIPGVSRSGATIVGGLALGIERRAVVLFSFLLALPTLAAATGYDLLRHAGAIGGRELALLAVGGAAAFVAARLALRGFLAFVGKHSFTGFGVYRIAIGAIGLLLIP